jgi:hypothetical protein
VAERTTKKKREFLVGPVRKHSAGRQRRWHGPYSGNTAVREKLSLLSAEISVNRANDTQQILEDVHHEVLLSGTPF